MSSKQKIMPCLWFDSNAEAAMDFYCSIFKNSKIHHLARYGDAGPGPKGQVMVGTFQLEGQQFMALNGGPMFKFTEAISLKVECDSQEEVDALWSKLTADGGAPSQCGWLKDKFGLSWQIVPSSVVEMLSDKDAAKSNRVMEAIMQMTKIDIEKCKQAYNRV